MINHFKKKFSSLIFWVWLFVTYGIDLVSIPRYYILVSYRSPNYGIEPPLDDTQATDDPDGSACAWCILLTPLGPTPMWVLVWSHSRS